MADKVSFFFGVIGLIAYSYIVGLYPHDLFYCFYFFLSVFMLRCIHYYSVGWHYYITDLCYFMNALALYIIMVDPKNERLIRICFLNCQGILALSVWMFKGSLVFHKWDILTNLLIHLLP